MDKQPTALRLADWLDAHANGQMAVQHKAAAELRRLHAVNNTMLEVLRVVEKRLMQYAETIDGELGGFRDADELERDEAWPTEVYLIRAAVAKAGEVK